MMLLVCEAWLVLLYFEGVMKLFGLRTVHDMVRKQGVESARWNSKRSVAELNQATDLACVFYFKQVLCLQRSAAMTVLLRRYGWKGEMLIGAKTLPFQAHAWVEVEGEVVNDVSSVATRYQVLERC